MNFQKVLIIALAALLAFVPSVAHADLSSKTAKGPKGQVLTVSQTQDIAPDSNIWVSGKNYNSKVGIYVTFCVIPKKGKRPELCGPYDITGQNNDSVWVSSNPPVYAALLVKPFKSGGSFRVQVTVRRMIGNYDCKVVRCAILTRADHTRSDDRSADVIIPVSIK
ncbi:MAG: hypothetical protein ACKOWR_01590 [Micrococcales bacterium]